MAISAARVSNANEIAKVQNPDGGGILREIIAITGATGVATDSTTYTIEAGYGFVPFAVVGGIVSATFSGRVATITLKANIGNDVVYAEVLIRPSGS